MSIDLYELNKLAGAVLFALLVLLGTRTVSNIIFASYPPETPGFEIEVADEPGQPGTKSEEKPEVPLANLLQTASAERGQKASRKCAACHTFDQGGASRVGPNLYDIVGAPLGHIDSFSYSPALKEKGGDWSYESLDAFIEAPKTYLPGTKMAFAGIRKPQERADLILYLRDQSASPKPLPEPVPEPETAEAGEATEAAGSEQAKPAEGADAKPAAEAAADEPNAEAAPEKPAAEAGADKPAAEADADKPAAESGAEAPKPESGAEKSDAGNAQAAENTSADAGEAAAEAEPASQ